MKKSAPDYTNGKIYQPTAETSYDNLTIVLKNNLSDIRIINELTESKKSTLAIHRINYDIFSPRHSYYWDFCDLAYIDNVLFNHYPQYNANLMVQNTHLYYLFYPSAAEDLKLTMKNYRWPHNLEYP